MHTKDKESKNVDEFIEDIHSAQAKQGAATSTDSRDVEGFTKEEQRKIIHKVDRRLVTGLGLLMGMCLMDRTNLGSTSIAGMSEDLGLENGSKYSLVLLIFFVPYVLVQLPVNAIAQNISPRHFSCGVTLCWGVLMAGAAFVKEWWHLMIIRALLGAFESSLYASLLPLLAAWYTRYDVHKRFSISYFISCLIAALGPVLACGFMQMGGLSGLAGWRYIFLMEGVLNFVAAIIGWLLLVEYPKGSHKCWMFLTEEEEAFIIRHINTDRADAAEHVKFDICDFLRPAKDWKVFTYPMMFLLSTCVSYSIAFFLPIILVSKLKFGVTAAQALSTPPYVVAGTWMHFTAWSGDRYHIRGPLVISNCLLSTVGLALLGWVASPGVQYFGAILVTSGSNANVPTNLAWQANNIRGKWKRSFCNALLIMGGGIGGIVGSLVFRSQDAPTYRPGIIASIVASIITMVISVVLMLRMHALNRKATTGAIVLEELPGFKYTL
ncbi:major facilitator superfamily domain-containing protein [Aspergillus caelatus]|uniref:Major facilitator superfamily domain-containing protein n=1 Tax=Aspergillus caelatus TaxID=61420 RepID=A0A5N6ZSL8_9EURO|nr:major facilitator superfamily domain-containing protein [Aspergillus caelatus]KAE8359230.1 major facilitator superfamily domain-containing protein [Aspergillus caelatus]